MNSSLRSLLGINIRHPGVHLSQIGPPKRDYDIIFANIDGLIGKQCFRFFGVSSVVDVNVTVDVTERLSPQKHLERLFRRTFRAKLVVVIVR